MTLAAETRPTKTHRGENFPVASRLVAARHRPAILAFYRFARAADDIADDPHLAPADKLARLDALEATLFGEADVPAALPLRAVLAERRLSARHPCDLLQAFRQDAEKRRYASWDELMRYCALSAAPVGRFVLDIHGESTSTWRTSDALCAALQVINHLQDCGKDYRALDRVYLPEDVLAAHGAMVQHLGGAQAPACMRAAIADLAERTAALLAVSASFPGTVADRRLRMEVTVIQRLAEKLVDLLHRRDPLSERVHLGKPAMFGVMARTGLAAVRLPRRTKRPA